MAYKLDQRWIYLLVIISIALPLLFGVTAPAARLKSAETLYSVIENLKPETDAIAMIAFDFGPSTKAENEPQAEVVFEHLLRKRKPVALISLYPQAESFLTSVPLRVVSRLKREFPEQSWDYGQDWINLGYKPGQSLFVQALAKSQDLTKFLGKDAYGSELGTFPKFAQVRTLRQVQILGEFNGLQGMFDTYVQFFQTEGYTPILVHGCTSIAIPEAYNYLDSGQLAGLLEGVAGAAWYSTLMKHHNPLREKDSALIVNTALGVAQLLIVLLVIAGNLSGFFGRFFKPKSPSQKNNFAKDRAADVL